VRCRNVWCIEPQFRGLGEQDLERPNVKIMPQNDASEDCVIANAVAMIHDQLQSSNCEYNE
jgi:hypothetical protein